MTDVPDVPLDDQWGGRADVYLSYALQDADWARWVRWVLQQVGYSVIDAQACWDRRTHPLRKARFLLVLLSPQYLKSPHAGDEWRTAWDAEPGTAHRRIITIPISAVEPPGLLATTRVVPIFGVSEQTARRRLLGAMKQNRATEMKPPFPGGRKTESAYSRSALAPVSNFVGREFELRTLHASLWGAWTDQPVINVVGPPGIGKTAFVAEYTARHRSEYADVIVASPGIRTADWRRELDDSPPGSVLLILDELPEKALKSALQYRDHRPHVQTIVITREPLNSTLVNNQIALGPLGRVDMRRFLQAELPGASDTDVAALIDLAGGLPLALRLVAGLAASQGINQENLINALRHSLTFLPSDEVDANQSAMWLAERYVEKFAHSGSLSDSFEAQRILRSVIEANFEREATHARSLLGALLTKQYQITGEVGALEESIFHLERAARAPASPDRPVILSNLATALRSRAELSGDPAPLQQAVDLLGEALRDTPEGNPDRPAMMSNLATALRSYAERASDEKALQESIVLLRRALEAAPRESPDRPAMMSNLATTLRSYSDTTGDRTAAQESITLLRHALNEASSGNPDRPAMMSNLATALRSFAELTGDHSAIGEAVALLRSALSEVPAGNPDRPAMMSNLATAQRAFDELTGDDSVKRKSRTLEGDSSSGARHD